jgi:uncharacterized repeat protein (TIGR01451 family)
MDLTIRKTHSPNTVVPGQIFTYFVTVLNVGESPSKGTVTVTETLPPGLTIIALSGPGWTCSVPTCTRSDALAPTDSYPAITVTTKVGANVAPGTVVNSAEVSGGGDPNDGNNTATDETTITSPASGADLTVAKAQTGGVVKPGQSITFTVRVTNVGESPTNGTVTMTEVPPPGLTVTALSGSGWTCIVATQTCIRDDELDPGMSYPDITVTASVAPGAVGTIANRVVVSGGEDSNPSNNTGSSPTPVPALPLSFGIGLMSALLAIALWALRARRFRTDGRT